MIAVIKAEMLTRPATLTHFACSEEDTLLEPNHIDYDPRFFMKPRDPISVIYKIFLDPIGVVRNMLRNPMSILLVIYSIPEAQHICTVICTLILLILLIVYHLHISILNNRAGKDKD